MGELRYVSAVTGDTIELDGPVTATDGALAIRATDPDITMGYRSIESSTHPAATHNVDAVFTDKDELDRVVSVIDADRAAMKPGVFYAAGCQQRGYLVSQVPKKISPASVEASVGFALLDGVWHRPRLLHLFPGSGDSEGTKRYAYRYPYRYASEFGVRPIDVISKVPVTFLMCIFGYVRNPSVKIAGNTYKVECTVPAGGYLLLDARDCSATLVGADGAKTDVFNLCKRGTGQGCGTYAWERIPAGASDAVWDDTFGFDLTLFEESSAPPFGSGLWT